VRDRIREHLERTGSFGHGLFESGVHLMQTGDQTAVFAAEPGAIETSVHASHELVWLDRLGEIGVGQTDSGDGVIGGCVPGEQYHRQIGILGFQRDGQGDPGCIGQLLIDNHQVRSVSAVVPPHRRSGIESLSGDPGQSQDLDDSRPDSRIVIDYMDHRRARRCVGGWRNAHSLSLEAWATRLSILRMSKGLLSTAKTCALAAARSRSSAP
jgi:hypothetical protein